MILKIMQKHFKASCPLPCIVIIIFFFHPVPAISENSVADEIISLNATDQPLGEVLKSISTAADCRFSIDANWEDYPITAAFDDEPLHRGLKLIFRNINNAVIYGEDRTVKIIIYDRGPDSGNSAGQSITINPPPESILQSQPFSEATAPQAEVEIAEEDSAPESLMKESEGETESGTETDGADSDHAQAVEEVSSDASGEKEEPTE
jgi:type II secretory pathway component GspD/PulD (secretin)